MVFKKEALFKYCNATIIVKAVFHFNYLQSTIDGFLAYVTTKRKQKH